MVSDYTGAMSTFDVSADGSRIAYSTCAYAEVDDDYEIVVSNIDGTDTKRLTDNSGSEFYPVWSPDGTRLAFVQRSGLTINTVATGESIDLPIHVAPIPPAWSPAGRSVAFLGYAKYPGRYYWVALRGGARVDVYPTFPISTLQGVS